MTQPPLAPPAADDARLVETWVARSASPHTCRKYRAQAARYRDARRPAGLPPHSGGEGLGDAGERGRRAQEPLHLRPGNRRAAVQHRRRAEGPAGQEHARRAHPRRARRHADDRARADQRNRALLTVLYGAGLRISEGVSLRWRDLAARDSAGQATVYGKGGKTRTVLLSANTWRILHELRDGPEPDAFVFRAQPSGRGLSLRQADRIVKRAAAQAGLTAEVSAHWLRHAHASHALDRGAPIHLVQATLGHASVSTTGRYLHARPSESSARFLGV